MKRVARTNCLRIPKFAHDMDKYRKKLKHMAHINGFDKARKIISLSFHNSSTTSSSKLLCKKRQQRKLDHDLISLPQLTHAFHQTLSDPDHKVSPVLSQNNIYNKADGSERTDEQDPLTCSVPRLLSRQQIKDFPVIHNKVPPHTTACV